MSYLYAILLAITYFAAMGFGYLMGHDHAKFDSSVKAINESLDRIESKIT